MKKFEVVFLDLDHTLVDTRRQYKLGLGKTLSTLYGEKVPGGWTEHFMAHHNELWGQYDRREITMATLRHERFVRAWRDFGVDMSAEDSKKFQSLYDAEFDSTLFPYEETAALVEDLAKEHRLGIITNGSPDLQERKLATVGLADYFPSDTVIISERIGQAKPHPSVYQAACDALGVTAADAVMIGDNYRADVEGANRFGMAAIWYVPDPEMASMPQAKVGHQPLMTRVEVLQELSRLEARR